MQYWIDTGVLIQAHRSTYPFDMVPQFWHFLHTQLEPEVVSMPRLAYEEIVNGGYDDQLVAWCKSRKKLGLCRIETKEVQQRYGQISAHVQEKYSRKPQRLQDWFKGADGWIIAYALATGGAVVTQETDYSYKSKIKLPTVATAFDVECLNTAQMLRKLKADFSKGV
jgi:predicted nucleic acid-binding protein